VPSEQLRRVLGIADVNYLGGERHLAVVDATLSGGRPAEVNGILRQAAAAAASATNSQAGSSPATGAAAGAVVAAAIGNFSFAPRELSVRMGAAVEWTNKDDTPHTITSDADLFSSPLMDTNQTFRHIFPSAGRFTYHCKLHPTMTGAVVVA
jgi:plastocyanin